MQQNLVVVERFEFISNGIKKIGFIPKKSNYKPKTLHHRRHGRDKKEKSGKTMKSKQGKKEFGDLLIFLEFLIRLRAG